MISKAIKIFAILFLVLSSLLVQGIELTNDTENYILVINDKTLLSRGKSMQLDATAGDSVKIDAYDLMKTDSETRDVDRTRLSIEEAAYGDIKLVGSGSDDWFGVKISTDFKNNSGKLVHLEEEKITDYQSAGVTDIGYILPKNHKTIKHGHKDIYTVTLYYNKLSETLSISTEKDKTITVKDGKINLIDRDNS